MRLREHPKIQWPPMWSDGNERAPRNDAGVLTDVEIIEPSKLLLSNDLNGKIYFAEIHCFNDAFASRLHDRIKDCMGQPIEEIGEIEL